MGVAMVAQYYIPAQASQDLLRGANVWRRVVAGFAIFLGAYSLFHLHWGRIRRRVEGWGYSGFFFLGAGSMMAFGFYNGGKWPLN